MFLNDVAKKPKEEHCIKENTPVAGISPVIGAGPGSLFITQYTMPTTFSSEGRVVGMALSNDIISDKVLTKIGSALTDIKSESFFKDRKIAIFKYIGEDAEEKFMNIYNHIGENISDEFLYEALSGKKMLSADQIQCDPLFKEVDFESLMGKLNGELATIKAEYDTACGKDSDGFPLLNDTEIDEAYELTKGDERYSIRSCIEGYFAIDNITGNRTGCYESIKEIPLNILVGRFD